MWCVEWHHLIVCFIIRCAEHAAAAAECVADDTACLQEPLRGRILGVAVQINGRGPLCQHAGWDASSSWSGLEVGQPGQR